MSWEKIDNHLFHKYCVEGEDEELYNLMEEHDKEIRAKAIDDVFDYLKSKRDKRAMKICFDDLEIRNYKEQIQAGVDSE